MDTLQYVQTCLDRTDKSMTEIALGAGVSASWLRMYRRGAIPDPAYSRIKRLADYFLRTGEVPVLADESSAQQQHAKQPTRKQMG